MKRVLILLPFFFLLASPLVIAQTDAGIDNPKASMVPDAGSKSTIPANSDQAIDVVKTVVKNFKDGEIRLGIAGILMLLIFVWRRFIHDFVLNKTGKKWAPLVVAALGFVSSLIIELGNPVFSWRTFLLGGLFTSGAAVLFWSTLGKIVLPKVFGDTKKKE
jgi:hypothetical protein